MVPLIFLASVTTHLFGGSAGREGVGVQMGGALADQLTHLLRLPKRDRRLLLSCGVSAGFASIFGTPLAGAIFALEVNAMGQVRYEALLPALLAALTADVFSRAIGRAIGLHHTAYHIAAPPPLSLVTAGLAVLAGIIFGLCGSFFARLMHVISDQFKRWISRPYLRPMVGGLIVALSVWLMGSTRYIGLGVPVIAQAFTAPLPLQDFLLKALFTTLTLGSGLKGGEVTPLFFIGSTLGSALSAWLALPTDLLAALGFVAVFAAASNTPLACLLMGMELFGGSAGAYLALSCFTAYVFSGHVGIYAAQRVGVPKHHSLAHHSGQPLGHLPKSATEEGASEINQNKT